MRLLFVLFSCLLFTTCGKDQGTDALMEDFIQQRVEERLARAQNTIMQRCYNNILEEAGEIADSILFENARLRKDTTDRPGKPIKPDEPEIKTLIDSVPIAPLFDSLSPSSSQ